MSEIQLIDVVEGVESQVFALNSYLAKLER